MLMNILLDDGGLNCAFPVLFSFLFACLSFPCRGGMKIKKLEVMLKLLSGLICAAASRQPYKLNCGGVTEISNAN